jgi:UDP-GlcNAc:undecaprenyl-phosphate GlcNAc-1-phosphate transferase
MNEIILGLAFLLSLSMVLKGTPITIKIAIKYGILDQPDGKLKTQQKGTPYLGGLIIYFAFISPVSLLFEFNRELLGLLFASSILLIVGLFDDLKALTPGVKFFFQIVATYILLKSGIFIQLAFLPTWLNSILSILWILTTINAFNLTDIMDGLASSIAFISLITLFVIAFFNHNFLLAMISISLAGACLGFLKFNWQTAKIYLGDSGSMFIGMILGALIIMSDYSFFNNYGFISGLFIFSIPLFDLLYVIVLRILKGKSPFKGSKDHFPLRLKKKYSLSVSKTVTIIIFLQLLISSLVILSFYSNEIVTVISSIFLILIFLILGIVLAREQMS